MQAIERVAECWRRLYFRNFVWASAVHATVHTRLLEAEPRVGAGAPCKGCGSESEGMMLFLGNGLVCESCLVHALAHLASTDSAERDIVLDLLLGEGHGH